ncbi:unnamed protein product [Rangifer tarandus platyrhynchus]|uniref:Uncharacterized protein n=2 Tax=Rangifer tarandus platyrhynchus TaxID=3082113 RepID=A0ACB0EN17_RANTA|nr:unnamed protein product [Rangifer tarandus platyrhynchus]
MRVPRAPAGDGLRLPRLQAQPGPPGTPRKQCRGRPAGGAGPRPAHASAPDREPGEGADAARASASDSPALPQSPAVVLAARSVKAGLLGAVGRLSVPAFAGPPLLPVRALLLTCRLVARLLFPSILFSAPALSFYKSSFTDSFLLVSQDPAQLQEASP